MKKPSTDLFRLIKSLTKPEKRAFRQKAIQGGEAKKYLKIFDAIEEQSEYNEEKIKQIFKNEKWTKRFNAAKDYLYKALLNELSVYNQKHDPKYKLDDYLIHIKVLQSKGFYSRCTKLIEQAKKLAIELEDHLKLLEALALESKNHPGGINPNEIESIRIKEQESIQLLQNEHIYNALYKKSYLIFTKTGYQGFDEKEKKAYAALMNNELLMHYHNASTFKSRRQFINMNYFYAVGNKNNNSMLHWILKAEQLFHKSPKFIKLKPVDYATTLLNLNSAYLNQNNFEAAFIALDKLRNFYPKSQLKHQERLTYILEYALLHHEITTYNKMGHFIISKTKLEHLQKYFKKHQLEISTSIQTKHHFLVAHTQFGLNNFKEALGTLNPVLDNSKQLLRQDLIKQAKILSLLAYYETEKIDLFEYKLRAIKRQFQKEKNFNALDKSILQLLGIILTQISNKNVILKQFTQATELSETKQFVPDYEIILNWVASKLEKTPFAIFIEKKYQTKKRTSIN